MTVRIRLKRQKRRSSFLKSGCSCGGFEAVLRKRTKKKSPENRLVTGLFGGELGIRTLEAFRLTAFRVLHLRPLGQLSVYVIPFSFEKLFARTDGKNNKIFNFRTEQKLSIYGDFEGSILPNSQKISSALRFDHFSDFLCQKLSALSCRKAAQLLDFLSVTPLKTALYRDFCKMGSNRAKMRFWAELRADRTEQRQNGNTRTAHR